MRIDLLLTSYSAITYETYAANRVATVCKKHGVPFKKIVLSDGVLQDYIQYIAEEPPRRILSFDPLLPYETPFCDLVGVPQLIWAKNSLSEAAHFLKSKHGVVGLPTPTSIFNTVFLPHGVEKTQPMKPLFDVVFFSPLVDTACLRKRWKEFFPEEVIGLLDTSIASEKPAYETLKEASWPISLCHTIEAVEEYLKAQRAYKVISSCTGYILDVFGEHIGSNWYQRLPNALSIRLHAPLPYTAHFEVLAQSKIAILDPLDSCWELPAAAAGCLPLMADLEDLHEQISFYIGDSKKREKALENYQEQIESRTWDNQTGLLIKRFYEN